MERKYLEMAHSSSPPDRDMTDCSVNSTSKTSFAMKSPQEKISHPSPCYHESKCNGRGDKFYRLDDLPPLETISRCISGFIRGTSTLLFVLPEYEAMELINAIYHPGTGHNTATNSKLCELLSIAAIGSQYEDIGQETQTELFKSAKWYHDSGFKTGGDELRKMRTSMLIGIFLIFEKSFWARDYIGIFTHFRLSDYLSFLSYL